MSYTKIATIFADSETLSGQEVTVGGWARTIRDMKNFGFVELNDGSCFKNLQVVMDANVLNNYKEIAGQNVGAALIVNGTVVLTPDAKQPLEVKAASIAVEGVYSLTHVTFDAEKWRSGLGAYFFFDCTSVQTAGGHWDGYTIGGEAIS